MRVRFAQLELEAPRGLVMLPRPATERLVDAAAARIGDRPLRVADVGTGSGAIAVALAVRAPRAEVWATDTSDAAVEIAGRNARRHGVGDRVHVLRGDLLEPIPRPLDLVAANLPYLPDSLAADPAYAEYLAEPRQAIFAPGDGLAPYRRLLDQAEQRLAPGGVLVVQFHRAVLEAERGELGALRATLEAAVAA